MKWGFFIFCCFWFVSFFFFAVKGIVLLLFFEGMKRPSKLHIHMHWNYS